MRSIQSFILFLLVIAMTGCSGFENEKIQLESKTEKLLIENNRLLDANISLLNKLKDAESQLSNVKAKLDLLETASESANLVTLFDVSFSPNQEYATAVFMNHLNDERPLYLYNMSEHTSKTIYCDNACGVIWSPDSQHFVIDQGTSVDRMGSLYSLKDNAIIITIGYMGSLMWINSSEVIYAEENKTIELDAALEIVGTTDVIRRNIITGESKILFSGTDQFYYMVFTEVATGEISVIKRFVGKDSQNKMDEKVVYSSIN